MNGCPMFGCLRMNNLEDAKEVCIQDKTCNGIAICPYSECQIYEIRSGPKLTPNYFWNEKEDILQLTRRFKDCEGLKLILYCVAL